MEPSRPLPLPLILGSSSKHRSKILADAGIPHTTLSPNINESAVPLRSASNPSQTSLAVARAKADRLAEMLMGKKLQVEQMESNSHAATDALVVASDQVVWCAGEVREKPTTEEQCRMWMREYSGGVAVETHTAVVVFRTATGQRVEGCDVARQFFKPVPEGVVDKLIAKGDIMYCCGGFLIDDELVIPYLKARDGDEDSIIGMPLKLLRNLISQIKI